MMDQITQTSRQLQLQLVKAVIPQVIKKNGIQSLADLQNYYKKLDLEYVLDLTVRDIITIVDEAIENYNNNLKTQTDEKTTN